MASGQDSGNFTAKRLTLFFLNGQRTKTFDPSFLMILIHLLKNVRTWSRFCGYICTVQSELFFYTKLLI